MRTSFSCSDKISYTTKDEVRQAAKRQTQDIGQAFASYRCMMHDCYHTGRLRNWKGGRANQRNTRGR